MLFILLSLSLSWSTTISGYIKNVSTGKAIPNANIIIKETNFGTSSNPYGYFHIDLEKGLYTISTSIIGFKTDIRTINVENDNIILEINVAPTILELSEIQVQGLFSSRLGYESIDQIHKNDIEKMNKESISDLLKNIPGVDVQFAHPNGRNTNISIRGSSDYKPGGYNNRILVLLDGFPILIPNSGSPDWNSLPLENIQRIEIEHSSASSQYGHNSMGGVVNLITNTNKINNTIKISTGSFNNGQASINYKQNNNNWTYGISTMLRKSNGHRFNADDKIQRLQTFLKYIDNKGRNYRISHLLSHSELGHPGFDLENSNKYRRSDRISQYIQLQGFYPIKTGLSMSHSLYINNFKTHYENRNDIPSSWLEEHNLDKETNYNDINMGIRSEMILTRLARWVVMIGYDVDWSRSKVDLLNQKYDNPAQISIGNFIQSKYQIGSGFNFITGIRYDYRRAIPGNDFQIRTYTNITPKVSISYSNLTKSSLIFSYSQGFRAPSISELYLSHLTTYGLEVKGNPELLPEKVSSIEFIYKKLFNQKINWEISIFTNKYSNMIDFVYNVPTIAKNRSNVIASGLEFKFMFSPINKLQIRGSYSYLNMNDKSGKTIVYRPKHKGKLNINTNLKHIDIQFGFKAQGKQYYEDFLDEFDYYEGFPIKVLPQIIIHEVTLSKIIQDVKVSLKLDNFLNTKYELIQNYTMPGNTWKFTLEKNIGE